MNYFVEKSAEVSDSAIVKDGVSIWHLCQIREGVCIGEGSVVGRGVYIGPSVEIGKNCKIQNHALIYDPARIGDGVFIGPAVILTNDVYPRAVDPDLSLKDASGWEAVGVSIGDGASIGARSVILAGVTVGRWALVAAGSVVIRDVPDFALVAGNPARQKAWVGRAGRQLESGDGSTFRCPETGALYALEGSDLIEVNPE